MIPSAAGLEAGVTSGFFHGCARVVGRRSSVLGASLMPAVRFCFPLLLAVPRGIPRVDFTFYEAALVLGELAYMFLCS